VANDLQVHQGRHTPTDTDIAHAVRRALEWDANVPHEHIHSTVDNGWVRLEGTVELRSQREAAYWVVHHIPGVLGVFNEIVVANDANTETILGEIEQALERRAGRAAKRIRVTVSDGTVTLTGVVDSWAEKEAVLGAARFTPGVQAVHDQLGVDPGS
jgi:osmotically-inducible protein OsmY